MKTSLSSSEDLDFLIFQRRIKEKLGLDLSCYKRKQMERRLRSLVTQAGAKSFREYLQMMERDPEMLEAFRNRVTINVSELFRDPDKFKELATQVLPALLARTHRPRIWSAGCSNGAEAYSLAMLLHEAGIESAKALILATDIDHEMLARAREGLFADADIKNVSAFRRRRFLSRASDAYRVSDDLRRLIEFRHHDLLSEDFETDFHLLLCRNVTIYFTDDAKERLYRRFYNSLAPAGVLLVGATERIFSAREIGFESISPFFYRRPEVERQGED